MSCSPEITVILVSFNTASSTRECLRALLSTDKHPEKEIIVIDNASHDGSAAMIRQEFPEVRLIANDVNVGFGRANNQGAAVAQGRYLLLLNTDAFIRQDTLQKTFEYMECNPRCGILGVKLLDQDGVLQPSARYFPTPSNIFLRRTGLEQLVPRSRLIDDMNWDHASIRVCDWVPGCFYLTRRELVQQVGLFDPRYFLYYEEVDHCLAAKRAGWDVVFFPDTSVTHLGGESAGSVSELTPSGRQIEALELESELLYFRKNHGLGVAVADALLRTLADVINVGKRLLRLRRPLGLVAFTRHSALVWSLLLRTRFGSTPIH